MGACSEVVDFLLGSEFSSDDGGVVWRWSYDSCVFMEIHAPSFNSLMNFSGCFPLRSCYFSDTANDSYAYDMEEFYNADWSVFYETSSNLLVAFIQASRLVGFRPTQPLRLYVLDVFNPPYKTLKASLVPEKFYNENKGVVSPVFAQPLAGGEEFHVALWAFFLQQLGADVGFSGCHTYEGKFSDNNNAQLQILVYACFSLLRLHFVRCGIGDKWGMQFSVSSTDPTLTPWESDSVVNVFVDLLRYSTKLPNVIVKTGGLSDECNPFLECVMGATMSTDLSISLYRSLVDSVNDEYSYSEIGYEIYRLLTDGG